jgi:hypothetical protein
VATQEDITHAIGCLSTVFPQFVAKELATLSDQILAGVQGFTDPLTAIGDTNLDALIDGVATLSEGDVFSNLGQAAAGLSAQFVLREASELMDEMARRNPSVAKRVQQIGNMASQLLASGSLMASLLPDLPYAAAQRMCETIIDLTTLKINNLVCLRKHITQLINCIIVLAKNVDTYVDETLANLAEASATLKIVQQELNRSQRLQGGVIIFDSLAFDRARLRLGEVGRLLTPDKDGTSILDVAQILTFGSVEAGHVNLANRALVTLVIPSLLNLVEVEVSAVFTQTQVINFHIEMLAQVIQSFRDSQKTSPVAEARARLIAIIRERLEELGSRIDLAIARKSTRAASAEMLLWSSRVKSILAMMDQVKELTLQEGSIEGPDKAFALEQAFQGLLAKLTAINNDVTVLGIEDPTDLRNKVLGLVKGARRIMDDIDAKRTNSNRMATFHQQALQVAVAQASAVQDSINVAAEQKRACEEFAAIDLAVRDRFDQLVNSLRLLGLDRAVDLLNVGRFQTFFESDLDSLSYLGVVIKCLSDTINGLDDAQTRQQIIAIRDSLVGKKTNQDVAAADTADSGRTRMITKLQETIADIQRNAKAVETIAAEVKRIGEQIGVNAVAAVEGFKTFLGNIDHLAVGAGGRLAAGLEEFSKHPNAGVVACETP